MIVIADIKYLHLSPFQEAIDFYLPSAKILHIFYGCDWTNLFYEPMPKDVKVYWTSMHGIDVDLFFDKCVINTSNPDAKDTLFLIDLSYSVGKKIFDKYIDIYGYKKMMMYTIF